jgi:hypothetical protein
MLELFELLITLGAAPLVLDVLILGTESWLMILGTGVETI